MNRFVPLKDTIGKTILWLHADYDDEIVLRFADGTWTAICIGDGEWFERGAGGVFEIRQSAAVQCGICTAHEWLAARERQVAAMEAVQRDERRRRYEILKAEFGD